MQTIITDNVKRFLELQEKVNNQIDEQGQAESKLVDELEKIGDNLSEQEISMVCELGKHLINDYDSDYEVYLELWSENETNQ